MPQSIAEMDFQSTFGHMAAQDSAKKNWADYEQLLRAVFFIKKKMIFFGQNRLPLMIWIQSVRGKRPWLRHVLFYLFCGMYLYCANCTIFMKKILYLLLHFFLHTSLSTILMAFKWSHLMKIWMTFSDIPQDVNVQKSFMSYSIVEK